MRADNLTPYHIGKKLRIGLPTGAVVEGTLKSLRASTIVRIEGRKMRPELRIVVDFEELKHREYGGLGGSYESHTDFTLTPGSVVVEL